MRHDWMIDVLVDLRRYARQHYCLALAEQLDDAVMVAAEELAAADRAPRAGRAGSRETTAMEREM